MTLYEPHDNKPLLQLLIKEYQRVNKKRFGRSEAFLTCLVVKGG